MQVNIYDDHDIFDGWGSYPPRLQDSPVFQGVHRSPTFLNFMCTVKANADAHLSNVIVERAYGALVAVRCRPLVAVLLGVMSFVDTSLCRMYSALLKLSTTLSFHLYVPIFSPEKHCWRHSWSCV